MTDEKPLLDALVAFLRACFDEDQEAAELAPPGPWHVSTEIDRVLAPDGFTVAEGAGLSGLQLRNTVLYLSEHAPDVALRDIATKRQLVDDYEAAEARLNTAKPENPALDALKGAAEALQRTIRVLGTSYSDRYGYQEAWRPKSRGNKRRR